MSPQETAFREAEVALDALVAAASNELAAKGVEIADNSARTYHYKNQYLFWSTHFTETWQVGYERARVTVCVTCMEPAEVADAAEVSATTVVEVFQTGQRSRVRKERETQIRWKRRRRTNLATFILDEMAWGRSVLSRAAP